MGHHSKNFVLGLFIAAALGGLGPDASAEYVDGYVEKNVDGDTIWVNTDQTEEEEQDGNPITRERLKIRMIGIDAPETHLPTPNGIMSQGHWGDRASEAMQRLAPLNELVTVDDQGKDRYGRTLGRVFHRNKDINLEMVRTGWAIPYIICEGKACNKQYFVRENVKAYLAACDAARDAGRGIFDPADPLEEMPFEFRLRHQERDPDKYVGDFKTKRLYEPEDYAKVDVCQRIFFTKLGDAQRAGYTLSRK